MGMNLIQTGRFNRLFQKLFSIKGGANVTEVGAEILPVMNIRIGAEVRYLEGWELFAIGTIASPIVAQTGAVQLRNPAGSGVIAVIEKVNFSSQSAQRITFSQSFGGLTADLANLTTPRQLDPRTRANSSLQGSNGNNVADLTAGMFNYPIPANPIPIELVNFEDQEWPLLPGQAFRILANTVNTDLTVNIRWRERALEESELK